MIDKDSKLIWEAHFSWPEPKAREGVLAQDMVNIIMDIKTKSGTSGRIMQSGYGNSIFTEEEAKMTMHIINADRSTEEPIKMTSDLMVKKGTRVEVRSWGDDKKFELIMLEPTEISDRSRSVISWQLLQRMNESPSELLEKWVDFSSSGKARSALKRLR